MGFAHPAGCPADSRFVPQPCPVTFQVTLSGATDLLLQMLPIVRVSSPSATAGDAWTLVTRMVRAGSCCKRDCRSLWSLSPAARLSLCSSPLDGPSRFRPCFRLILVLTKHMLTGFTYRGLSPHKFTPMPGVHMANAADTKSRAAD